MIDWIPQDRQLIIKSIAHPTFFLIINPVFNKKNIFGKYITTASNNQSKRKEIMSSKDINIDAFYNNKRSVGKTTLCSNASSLYAKNNPSTQVLVIDMCPQANISQFLLNGGQTLEYLYPLFINNSSITLQLMKE